MTSFSSEQAVSLIDCQWIASSALSHVQDCCLEAIETKANSRSFLSYKYKFFSKPTCGVTLYVHLQIRKLTKNFEAFLTWLKTNNNALKLTAPKEGTYLCAQPSEGSPPSREAFVPIALKHGQSVFWHFLLFFFFFGFYAIRNSFL